jgi:hypothetical protein
MENAGKVYGHSEYFTVIRNILRSFGIFYGHFGDVVVIWYISPTFWYIVSRKIWQPWCELLPRKWGMGTTSTYIQGESGFASLLRGGQKNKTIFSPES